MAIASYALYNSGFITKRKKTKNKTKKVQFDLSRNKTYYIKSEPFGFFAKIQRIINYIYNVFIVFICSFVKIY